MLRILILVIALGAGGGAAWIAYATLSREDDPTPVAETEPVAADAALVATRTIAQGEEIAPDTLRWQPWPEEALSDGMILRSEQPDALERYAGWTSRRQLLAGEPLRLERLIEGDGGLMSLMLTPGMRAVAVRVSAESGAGGFVMPEDRVDVIHTEMRETAAGGGQPVSETIIGNVRVLAVDQLVQQTEGGAAKVAETATLELTPEQVEELSNARSSGQLSLALRSVADFDEPEVGELAALTPAPAAEPHPQVSSGTDALEDSAPAPTPVRVRIVGSGKVETLEFEPAEASAGR